MTTDVITENITVQNATADNQYSGLADTMIVETEPTNNFNSGYRSDGIEVTKFGSGDHNHTIIRGDGLSNISSSATVSSATLYIYQSGNNASYSVDLRRMLQAWTDSGATWNTHNGTPTTGDWNTGGALGAGTDRTSTPESTTSIGTTNSVYYALDCTSLVQDIIDGTISSDEGFHLERNGAGEDSTFKLFTSSSGTDGQRPELVVVYTVGGGVTIPVIMNHLRNQGIS